MLDLPKLFKVNHLSGNNCTFAVSKRLNAKKATYHNKKKTAE
jgi:hypothetical protein